MPRKPANAKPRCDSWDATLSDEQRWSAYDKFVQFRAKWWEVAAWVSDEFAIPSPSRSGLYRFWERMKKDEAGWRVRQCIDARSRAGDLARRAGQNDEELISAYQTLAADAALQFGDTKRAMLFTKMAALIHYRITKSGELEIKGRAQQTKDSALRLAREKFEAAEARLASAKTVAADASLTDEQRVAKIKEIFGM